MSALERYQDRLNIFASWFNLHTLESAAAQVTEAETLATATETLVTKVIKQVHNHEPPEAAAAMIPAPQAPQAQGTAAKLVMALKPDRLSFDANLGAVRRWKQRFRAFLASFNLRVLSLPDQQAFLIACILSLIHI